MLYYFSPDGESRYIFRKLSSILEQYMMVKRPETSTPQRNISQSESFIIYSQNCWILRTCGIQLHYRDVGDNLPPSMMPVIVRKTWKSATQLHLAEKIIWYIDPSCKFLTQIKRFNCPNFRNPAVTNSFPLTSTKVT